MNEGAFPGLDSFWPRGEFSPNWPAGQAAIDVAGCATTLSRWLSCLTLVSCLRDFPARLTRRSEGPGHSVSYAAGGGLRFSAAHNATLCLGPLGSLFRARSGVFEAGLLLSGCAGRAPARHPNITLRDYAQRSGGSAVRAGAPHNSRYVHVPASSSSASSAPRCSFAGCVASWISRSLSIDTCV